MRKGNGRIFTVVSGSKQSYQCPLLDTSGPVPLDHLMAEVYSEGNKVCRKCGVCAASLQTKAPTQKEIPVVRLREKVRPHGCDATREKTILRVSAGMAKR